MKRRVFLFGSLAPAIAACRRDRRPRLNVYNWSAYVAPETIPNFEKEFGVRVRYVTYESNEEMLAQVITGNSGWDVVFPTHNRVPPMSAMGLLAPLDRNRLKNLGNLEPQFQSPSWDRGLEWCVPYMWFGTGIAFNRSVTPPPSTWADLWSPRFKGRLTMLDDPEDVIGASLMKLRLPFGSTDPAELHRAERELFQQKPLVRAYLNAEVRDQLVSGDVLGAVVVDDRGPGTRRRAVARFRLPGRRLPAILRLCRHPAREPPPRVGARVSGLFVAPGGFRRHRAKHVDCDRQRRGTRAVAGQAAEQRGALPASRCPEPRRVAGHAAACGTEAARPDLDRSEGGVGALGARYRKLNICSWHCS